MLTAKKYSTTSNTVGWMLIFIPISALAVFVWRFSVNTPYGDDYDSILNALLEFGNAKTSQEFFHYLVMQHNEHRIVFARLIPFLYTKIFGLVNFKSVIELGFLQIVFLLFLLAKIYGQKLDVRILWPVSVLLFQPSYHETILWATTTWSNVTVILFAFSALYMLLGKHQHIISGLVLATLATYSQANGVFTFVAGAIGLLAQRRYRHLVAWAIISAAISFVFFFDYQSPPNHPTIDLSLQGIWNDIQFFTLLLGSIGKNPTTSTIFGIAMIVGTAFFTNFLWRKQSLLGSLILFLLMTAASAALARSPLGIKYALLSRYTVGSAVLLIVLYFSALQRFPQRTTLAVFGIFSISLSLYHWGREGDQSKFANLLTSQAKVGSYCYQNLTYPKPYIGKAVNILESVENQGVFFLRKQTQADADATLFCFER